MIARDRQQIRRGSRRWAAGMAEVIAWATVAFSLVVLHGANLSRDGYVRGLVLLAALAAWLFVFFRILLYKRGDEKWVSALGIAVDLGFATALFALLRGEVPSIQLIFVPVIVVTGLLATMWEVGVATGLAIVAYFAVAIAMDTPPELIPASLTVGLFTLSGSVAGVLSRELRAHFAGEQKEQQRASTVRHRLFAVLDAIDEAIIFRDRQGLARVINERAAEIFDIDPARYLGRPGVELLRSIARKTEDPEGFMEIFQQLRSEPDAELRVELEQLLPERRQLRLSSHVTRDDDGSVVGRIDVYTDITESVRRAAQIEVLYEQARKTAESFQRGLLPDSPPNLPRVSLVAHYVAAGGSRAICGDFYDFVHLSDGRMGFVLGDVCGIGPQAASDAALTRYTLRSLSTQTTDPAELLETMNTQIYAQSSAERFVRLIFAALDPERAVFEYANAGHVPPILYRARTNELEWLGEGGLALGIEEDLEYKAGRIELDPGDMLVFYTDGVTEAPRHGRPFGQGKFGDIVSDYGVGTPGELVQALHRSVESWVSEGDLRDDLAIVVCQIAPDRMLGEPAREIVLPNEPSRVPQVRAFVAQFLADIRAPVAASSEVLLAVGEAAANAYRHGRRSDGRSEVRVYCALEGPSISVTIADDGPGFDPSGFNDTRLPERYASGGRGLFLMRELMDEVEFDSSDEGTSVTLFRRLRGASKDQIEP